MTTFHARADYRQRNADLIATYQRCRSIANRNAVIHANLPLVWRVARQEAKRSGHNFDDLTQEGCFGLVQAVERFDPRRGHTLSTAATPWIRGAIRHYLRDRSHAVSGSHHLLELHRRGQALQELRQRQGLRALSSEQLAEALGAALSAGSWLSRAGAACSWPAWNNRSSMLMARALPSPSSCRHPSPRSATRVRFAGNSGDRSGGCCNGWSGSNDACCWRGSCRTAPGAIWPASAASAPR